MLKHTTVCLRLKLTSGLGVARWIWCFSSGWHRKLYVLKIIHCLLCLSTWLPLMTALHAMDCGAFFALKGFRKALLPCLRRSTNNKRMLNGLFCVNDRS